MRLLIYAPSYHRIERALTERAPGVTPMLMHDDGSLWLDGRAVALSDATPEVAWLDTDLYVQGPLKQFMVHCLKSRSLRWMHSNAAGYDEPIFAKITGNGVMLTNSDATAITIAEFVFASVLDSYHPERERRAAQTAIDWQRLSFREINASTWLIYGMGHIGSEIATRAQAFGAHVIGVRRNVHGDEPAHEMLTAEHALQAVPRADVVVLSAASNAQTHHVVDAAFLSAMRPGSLLVNIARGGLIDEAALHHALQRGVPERALLDVFETEPLPQSSPLWSHPRVRITAHCAGASPGAIARGDALFVENLTRYVNQEPLLRLVPPSAIPRPTS